jgi:hypothetical protein
VELSRRYVKPPHVIRKQSDSAFPSRQFDFSRAQQPFRKIYCFKIATFVGRKF